MEGLGLLREFYVRGVNGFVLTKCLFAEEHIGGCRQLVAYGHVGKYDVRVHEAH
jgi:hypothetical protein